MSLVVVWLLGMRVANGLVWIRICLGETELENVWKLCRSYVNQNKNC